MVTKVRDMVTQQFTATDLVQRLTEQRASDPEVEQRLASVEDANRRIGKLLVELRDHGLEISTQVLPGLGVVISDTSNLGGIEKTSDSTVFEGVTEVILRTAGNLGDFIKALRQLEPGVNQFDIKLDDKQTLSLWGSGNAKLQTRRSERDTHVLSIHSGDGMAMQDCETPGPANVLRTNPKFDYGFTPATKFEEVGINAHNDTTVGTGSHVLDHHPALNVRLGRGLTRDGGLGDQAYTALLNGKEHPSGKFSDSDRAFATRLAQISPIDEVALPAQFLDPKLIEDFRRRAKSSFGLGVPVRPRPYSREEFLQVTAA